MIRFADWEMRSELAQIWEVCFEEPARPAKYFLNNYFRPQNCLIYQNNNKIAAVVYLLPAQIAVENKPVQAHYIFAAATLPQYRGHGYMAALMAAAALVGTNRGDQYSAVLPANSELYKLYQKSGYTTFFQISTQSVSLDKMCVLAESRSANKVLLTYQQLNELRNSQLGTGSVLWSDDAFCFADGIGRVYGDKLICSKTGEKYAYAICRRIDEDACKVLELMANGDTIHDLAVNIICSLPAQNYIFRLTADSTLLGIEGQKSEFGMIKPIGGTTLAPLLQASSAPYLGLCLD
jgi:GNAT superfamily N-acetyltransferase